MNERFLTQLEERLESLLSLVADLRQERDQLRAETRELGARLQDCQAELATCQETLSATRKQKAAPDPNQQTLAEIRRRVTEMIRRLEAEGESPVPGEKDEVEESR